MASGPAPAPAAGAVTGSRTVALTGATGFVGSNLARALNQAGWRVRALTRPGTNRARLQGLPLELVEGALEDSVSLTRLVAGADAVIHCAGAVRGATQAAFDRVNVDGTARLAAAAAAISPQPIFIHLSSLAAREPGLSFYAASKGRGETVLREAAAEGEVKGGGALPWVIVRPPALYGPGDKELLPVWRSMMRGLAPVVGSPQARFSLLYVDDLNAALLTLLECPRAVGGVYELHDGHQGGYSWGEVIDIAARVRGGQVLRVPIPPALLAPVAGLNLGLARLSGRAPMLTPGKLRELRHPDWVCDNGALTQASGWIPRVGLEQGLRRTLSLAAEPS